MTKRMLIDASHAEETRVVVLDGSRLEDFDVETSTKRQLKGNIYLAKVVRVEPSLQAAFVEYGGNRHGFLAFSEIHPDYYQIPVADRQRLLEMQAEDARREEEEEDLELALHQAVEDQPSRQTSFVTEPGTLLVEAEPEAEAWALAATPRLTALAPKAEPEPPPAAEAWARPDLPRLVSDAPAQPLSVTTERRAEVNSASGVEEVEAYDPNGDHIEALPPPETVGGGDHESGDDQRERHMPPRFLRNYKIQEVIRRRQILLVQVVKEERGTKGAALTTYLSLAGRFGVLMPNSPRGGGISRKITSAADRRRLKEVMAELDIPRGMGMIVRTAGANRPKPEIKRDCEYLLRLWDDIREHTMKSIAPALIYEEASLIKRAIRDVYSRDIDEILVDGEEGWRAAHDFMRMLMPSHAKKVQFWRDGGQPLFAKSQVEAQLDAMLMPTVQLRSGGYLVINQAEALVAIDVNSGRSTRERNIEETALRTNLEAADEVARQLRLRDLAGLIVIDFIDMESKRHNAMVERRIKEALKNDRARIQVGHISHFGLLEMSRQRLRPSLAETSFILCPHCGGTGHVRSTESAAIHVLRGIEEEGSKRRAAEIIVHVSSPVALYLLNHKRERLQEIEQRYVMRVIIAADDAQIAPRFRIDRVRTRSPDEAPAVVMAGRPMLPPAAVEEDEEEERAGSVEIEDEDIEDDVQATPSSDAPGDTTDDIIEETTGDAADDAGGDAAGTDEAERRPKRRRRRRRSGRREEAQPGVADETGALEPIEPAEVSAEAVLEAIAEAAPTNVPEDTATGDAPDEETAEEATDGAAPSEDDAPNRRRGRRGGRRRRRENEGELSPLAVPGADQPELQPAYAGPTPADPFGGRAFDIFDVMDQAERAAEARPAPRAASAAEIVNNTAPEPERSAVEPQPAALEVDTTEPATPEPVTGEMAAAAIAEAAVSPPATEPEPAPVPPKSLDLDTPILNSAAPEPAGEALAAADIKAASPPSPANDTAADILIPEPPPAEPLVKPIMVGAGGEPLAAPKRGWWRR